MTVFIHIGLNKTGSSSIQKFCHENSALLKAQGVVYPNEGIHDSAHYGISKMFLGKPDDDSVAGTKGLEKTILSAVDNGKDVLLSSEYFFLANDQQVAQIKEYFSEFGTDMKVIIYLRRHDLWIASLFNQVAKTTLGKHPWQMDIRDYFIYLLGLNDMQIWYPKILDRWAAHFGVENIIVRPFEVGQFRYGDLLWDFLGSIRDELPGILQQKGLQPTRTNESIPDELARVISHVRDSSLDLKAKNDVTALILKSEMDAEWTVKHRQSWDNRAFELSLVSRRSIVKFFADDYAYIANKYLKSEDGILFRDAVNEGVKAKKNGQLRR